MLYEALRRNGVPTRFLMGPWNHIQAATAPGLPSGKVPTLDALALRGSTAMCAAPTTARCSTTSARSPTSRSAPAGGVRRAAGCRARCTPRPTTSTAGRLRALPAVARRRGASIGQRRRLPGPCRGLCTRSASQWTAGLAAVPGCETDNQLNDQPGTAWETRPLRQAVHLMGPVNARLFVHTTARDGMLSVAVEDVAPDGSVDRLTGGWQVLSHRATTPGRALRRDGECCSRGTRSAATPSSRSSRARS